MEFDSLKNTAELGMQCSIILNRMSASVTTEFLALQKSKMESLWGKKNVESMHPHVESQLWTQMPQKSNWQPICIPIYISIQCNILSCDAQIPFLPSEYRFQYLNSADTKKNRLL